MYQEVSDVERRLSELQAQVDRLSLSLHLWFEKQEQLPRPAAPDVPAATTALQRTEARLESLESGVHRRLNDLSGQIQSMAAELRAVSRAGLAAAAPADSASWPLEDVVRLHSQLRGASDAAPAPLATPAGGSGGGPGEAAAPPGVRSPLLLPEAPAEVLERIAALERDVTAERARIRESAERSRSSNQIWRAGIVAAIVIGAITIGLIIGRLQNQLRGAETRVAEAETLAATTAQTAVEQMASARQEVDRQLAEANAVALQAHTIGDLLTAPDLVRYNMVGQGASAAARGQTIFSRSRGLVFTASGLPQPPAGSTYQLWLLTYDAAYSAGVFVPDASGRYTLASDQPPTAPPPIVAVSVTIEPGGGGARPTGRPVLAVSR